MFHFWFHSSFLEDNPSTNTINPSNVSNDSASTPDTNSNNNTPNDPTDSSNSDDNNSSNTIVIKLSKKEIDKAVKDVHHQYFSPQFRVEIQLERVSSSTPTVAILEENGQEPMKSSNPDTNNNKMLATGEILKSYKKV